MIVATYAGLLALLYVVLSFSVIIVRYRTRILLGDGGDFELKRRIRAHANFIEYTPLFLILAMLAEIQDISRFWEHLLCAAFLFGRIAHALSVSVLEKYENGKLLGLPLFRSTGMVLSFIAIISMALTLIAKGL